MYGLGLRGVGVMELARLLQAVPGDCGLSRRPKAGTGHASVDQESRSLVLLN